ncbi:MAG: hypothetical protein VX949_00410, partial [Planctomycetota bacterium]|nr:hypothetical protein [Planctomycetota bacterium]
MKNKNESCDSPIHTDRRAFVNLRRFIAASGVSLDGVALNGSDYRKSRERMRQLFLITSILAFSATSLWAQTGGDECDVADVISIAGFGTYAIAMDNTTATTGVDPVPVIPCGAFMGIFNQDIWFSFVPDA